MNDLEQILDLIEQWESSRECGHEMSIEELCAKHPDLIPVMRIKIALLRASDWMDSDPIHSQSNRLLAGRFRLEKRIGEGSYGQVWKALDEQLLRHVAVKVPKPSRRLGAQQLDDLLVEARRVSRLRHPGIVTVYDVFKEGAAYVIISDLIEGGDLATALRIGRITVDESVRLVTQVARILDYAHQSGSIHRDIKPANILLNETRTPHVCDFGIATTQQELLAGNDGRATLAYASPEQITGSMLDHRTDIWSLGVVFYELLTGRRPFEGDDPEQLKERILTTTPYPLVDIPDSIVAVCLRCLSKRPEDRFTHAADIATALESAITRRSSRRGFLIAAAGTCIVGLGITVLMLAKFGGARPNPTSETSPVPVETRLAPVAIPGPEPLPPQPIYAPQDNAFRVLRGHLGPVRAVAVSPDGDWVASGGDDGTLRLWPIGEDVNDRVGTTPQEPIILPLGGSVGAIDFAVDGQSFLVGTATGKVQLWGMPATRTIPSIPAVVGRYPIGTSGIGLALFARLPVPDQPWLMREFPMRIGSILAVTRSLDRRLVAFATSEKVELWSVDGKQPLMVAHSPGKIVHQLAFGSSGGLFAAFGVGEARKLDSRIWRITEAMGRTMVVTPGKLTNLDLFSDKIYGMTISNSLDRLVFTLKQRVIVFAQRDFGFKPVGNFEYPTGLITSMLYPGDRIVSVGDDRLIQLWAISNQESVARWSGHTGEIHSIARSQDGHRLASASEDGTVRVWRMPGWNREIAQRILEWGGSLRIMKRDSLRSVQLGKLSQLPAEQFEISEVDLTGVTSFTEADLGQIQSLPGLKSLRLPVLEASFLLEHLYAGIDSDGSGTGLRIRSIDGANFRGEHLVFAANGTVRHAATVTGTIDHGQIRYAYQKRDILKDGGLQPVRIHGTITRFCMNVVWELLEGGGRGQIVMTPQPHKQ